jgi:type IV pilus assembly protein PilM
MASKSKMVWGVDIGNSCLKAMRIRESADGLAITDIDRIEYSSPLVGLNMDDPKRKQVISETLRAFIDRHSITKSDDIAISVPGQSSFARFISLPPVEPKGIPKIVQYEAVQQIPFDINEVEWDWQLMEKPDSPELEVGIFAIKNELINSILEPFQLENLKVTTVQMGPMSLYNYACHEFKELDPEGTKAVVIVNMGTENTELVICSKTKVWQRVIPIGGNNFTNAIADAFKLNFEKAEKLKRTAPMSKYAKQIFHAMRPVFTDMASEIQRSVGYFSTTSRGVKFVKVIALGGAMKLQGVTKYLQQTLQMPVIKPEKFESLTMSAEISAASVHENVSDMGIAYGLGIQGLGLAKVQSNLLPRRIARSMAWARKAQVMTIAAGILLIVSFISFSKALMDKKSYDRAGNLRNQIEAIVDKAETASRQLQAEEGKQLQYDQQIAKDFDVFKYRDVIPQFKQTILKCLPNEENNPSQKELYLAFKQGDVDKLTVIPRKERKQLFITSMKISYSDDLRATAFGQSNAATTRTRTSKDTGGGAGGMPGGMPGMPGGGFPGGADFGFPPPGAGGSRGASSQRSSRAVEQPQEQALPSGSGFIIEIEGYSPYEKINEILDPIGVGENQMKWGFVTRLKNLDKIGDSNSLFEILDTSSTTQFIQETEPVDLASTTMPEGIGQLEKIQRAKKQEDDKATGRTTAAGQSNIVYDEDVLIDPLTEEEISKVYVLDDYSRIVYDSFDNPQYKVNDHWFRIKAKFIWRQDPAKTADQSVQ